MDRNKTKSALILGFSGVVTAGLLAASWWNTRVEYFQVAEHGRLATRVQQANVLFGVLAVLLFSLSIQWLVERKWLRFAMAFPALPAWCLVLLFVETFIVRQTWVIIRLAPLAGIQVFGT